MSGNKKALKNSENSMKKVFVLIGAAVFSVFLYSNLTFAQGTGLTLTYPNGGEKLTMGTGCIITWTSEGDIANVKLEYSTDGGDTYTVITNSTENDGAYTWYVPNSLSSNCLVRINDAAGTASDTSNASFSIVSSRIIVTFPKGEEWLRSGWTYDITWMTIGTVGNVKIEYSTDGGGTYSTIVESTENDGRYAWTVPDINTNEALIKVSEENGTAKDDVSDSPFHILYFTNFAQVTLNLTVQCDTPDDESVCVGFDWREPVKMAKVGENQWQTTIDFYTVGDTMKYRYCRNCMESGADEAFGDGNEMGWRSLTVSEKNMTINDTVTKWRWWPIDGSIPEIDTSSFESTPPDCLPRPSFQSGVMLPDFWWNDWEQCSDVVGKTLDKIAANTKATWVEYSPIPEIIQFYPSPIILREGNNSTPDADLVKIITESHKHGLKVFMNPFPWSINVQDSSPQKHSEAWWRAFEMQWRPIMMHYAQIAQEYGVEMFGFRMWPSIYNLSEDEAPIVDLLARNLLKDIRKVYKGKIVVQFWLYSPDMEVYGKGDYLSFLIWPHFPWHLADSKDATVDDMVAKLGDHLDNELLPARNKWGKDIIVEQVGVCSYDGANTGEPYFETQLYYYKDDPNIPVDLQEQADGYEAILHALAERNWIAGAYSFNYNYWDSIDKAPSVRSKPAEKVVAKWFRWITNRADLNRDGYVDLKDAILSLQIISDISPSAIRPDYAISHADVNGDAKVGLQEAIYILQKASGLR